jgi:hypothetical protein
MSEKRKPLPPYMPHQRGFSSPQLTTAPTSINSASVQRINNQSTYRYVNSPGIGYGIGQTRTPSVPYLSYNPDTPNTDITMRGQYASLPGYTRRQQTIPGNNLLNELRQPVHGSLFHDSARNAFTETYNILENDRRRRHILTGTDTQELMSRVRNDNEYHSRNVEDSDIEVDDIDNILEDVQEFNTEDKMYGGKKEKEKEKSEEQKDEEKKEGMNNRKRRKLNPMNSNIDPVASRKSLTKDMKYERHQHLVSALLSLGFNINSNAKIVLNEVLQNIPNPILTGFYTPFLASGDFDAIMNLDLERFLGRWIEKFNKLPDNLDEKSIKKLLPTPKKEPVIGTKKMAIAGNNQARQLLKGASTVKAIYNNFQKNGILNTLYTYRNLIGSSLGVGGTIGLTIPDLLKHVKEYLYSHPDELNEADKRSIEEEISQMEEIRAEDYESTLEDMIKEDHKHHHQQQESLAVQEETGELLMGQENADKPPSIVVHDAVKAVQGPGFVNEHGNLQWQQPQQQQQQALNNVISSSELPTTAPPPLRGKEELGEMIMEIRSKNPAEFGTDEERMNMGRGALNPKLLSGLPSTYPLGKEDKDLYFVRGIKKASEDKSQEDKFVSVWATTTGTRGQKLKNSNKAMWAYHADNSKWERLYGESYIKGGSKYDRPPYESWDPRKGSALIESESKLSNMLIQLKTNTNAVSISSDPMKQKISGVF